MKCCINDTNFLGGRSTSESSSGYDSSEILEMAARAAGVIPEERVTPARRMSRPTVLPIATERYAQRMKCLILLHMNIVTFRQCTTPTRHYTKRFQRSFTTHKEYEQGSSGF